MSAHKATYSLETMPVEIPVFPLPGVLLLPGGLLPLHIFESKFINMVDDALMGNRLIGMVQPKNSDTNTDIELNLYQTGCVGRITSLEETEDGRYYITLSGISRFIILNEDVSSRGYRRAKVEWQSYYMDLKGEKTSVDLDRQKLSLLLERYFDINNLQCDWDIIENVTDDKLITCLSMICPLSSQEKQALLEAHTLSERANMFLTMIEMAIEHGGEFNILKGKCH